jgi:hypothetical protein
MLLGTAVAHIPMLHFCHTLLQIASFFLPRPQKKGTNLMLCVFRNLACTWHNAYISMKEKKMRYIPCIALALASFASAQAQSPNAAISFNIALPMGEFREKIYAPWGDVDTNQIEGYDVGIGGTFTLSFPVSSNLAIRAGIGAISSKGTNTAQGYMTQFLRHSNVMVSSELQFFTKSAYQHSGTYLFAGISGNFERFEMGDDDKFDRYTERLVNRINRAGGSIGIGHTFYGNSGVNFVTELSYHATLTSKDFYRGDPPAVDFAKISFGMVF